MGNKWTTRDTRVTSDGARFELRTRSTGDAAIEAGKIRAMASLATTESLELAGDNSTATAGSEVFVRRDGYWWSSSNNEPFTSAALRRRGITGLFVTEG